MKLEEQIIKNLKKQIRLYKGMIRDKNEYVAALEASNEARAELISALNDRRNMHYE